MVVTETRRPARIGVKTESRGSALCLTDTISGTASLVVATMPASFRPAKRLRWAENSESEASDGCTETITSLARYATLATADQALVLVQTLGLPIDAMRRPQLVQLTRLPGASVATNGRSEFGDAAAIGGAVTALTRLAPGQKAGGEQGKWEQDVPASSGVLTRGFDSSAIAARVEEELEVRERTTTSPKEKTLFLACHHTLCKGVAAQDKSDLVPYIGPRKAVNFSW